MNDISCIRGSGPFMAFWTYSFQIIMPSSCKKWPSQSLHFNTESLSSFLSGYYMCALFLSSSEVTCIWVSSSSCRVGSRRIRAIIGAWVWQWLIGGRPRPWYKDRAAVTNIASIHPAGWDGHKHTDLYNDCSTWQHMYHSACHTPL